METKTFNYQFVCPKHGTLPREDVIMTCNRCDRQDLTYKDGMYLCPSCNGNEKGNFVCMLCGNDEVKMVKMRKKEYIQ